MAVCNKSARAGRLIALATAISLAAVTGYAEDLAPLQKADGVAAASPAQQAAWAKLAASGPDALLSILQGMKDTDTVGQNWLRAAFDAAAERIVAEGGFPLLRLQSFLADQSQSPRARQTAFEWVVKVDPSAKEPLLEKMLDDRSLALRYRAVAALLAKADGDADEAAAKKELYAKALTAARDEKQLKQIAATLEELGESVDLPGVMGFLKQWRVIGPFDNTGLAHFDTAYPPESEQDFAATYPGKQGGYPDQQGGVSWKEVTATGEGGEVDFIEPLGKVKEAVAYAYTTFNCKGGAAQVRYQSKNATKVWLNGELIATNEVYHSGGGIDQYRAKVRLKPGENTLLVKALQNEQKMPWEREWDFRLRVVDELGTPLASQ